MPVAAVRISLPWSNSATPGPVSVNTLYVDTGVIPITTVSAAPIVAAVETLYTSGLTGIWSPLLSGVMLTSVTDLSDPAPRVPVLESEDAITLGAVPVPNQVAVNVGYRATYATGVSKRKFKGRVYLGPVGVAALEPTTSQLQNDACDQIAEAFQTFGQAIGATDDYAWVCGSEANGWKPVTIVTVPNDLATLHSRQMSRDYVASATV